VKIGGGAVAAKSWRQKTGNPWGGDKMFCEDWWVGLGCGSLVPFDLSFGRDTHSRPGIFRWYSSWFVYYWPLL